MNNSDDARNPSSEPYRNLLLEDVAEVMVYDPNVLNHLGAETSPEISKVVKDADVAIVFTGYKNYFEIDPAGLQQLTGQKHPIVD
ncbi:MAG: UDP binding domain-containing protein [Methanosarcinaceae archaeon]